MKVEFFRHNIGKEDIQKVKEVLQSIFLTTGPVTAEFEKKLSRYAGLKEVVGVSSCTAALHLSLLALGIGPGDEVITTPMTFIATATSILHSGAKPVFIDVEEDTGLIDVCKLESIVTSRTRAILPVHLYGVMADMKAIRKIADKYKLKIIEDAAHCIEGERDGIRPGQLGDTACYSFYATKSLTCGEGGAVGTNNPELAEKIRILRIHGMSKDALSRYSGRYRHWDMSLLGWKYNMSDIQAALLVKQINRLEMYWRKRQAICKKYDEGLGGVHGIKITELRGRSARHLYTILVDPEKRDNILRKIQDKGIGVAVNFKAIHTLTYFRDHFGFKAEDFPVANLIGNSTISLPLYPCLKDYEIKYVINTVKKIVKGL